MANQFYKMKKSILLAFISVVYLSFSSAEIKNIDTKKSTIQWKGSKVIGSSHIGAIQLKSGYFLFENNRITGGDFAIDMNTINCTDLKNKKKVKLEKHLKAVSFFGVKKHPTATFKIATIVPLQNNTYKVTGNLTIKKHTNINTFILTVSAHTATGKMTIKRDEFDIKYSSGFFAAIGNKAISNTFTLNIHLIF